MTPEEFARFMGVGERFVKMAADAMRGERQPIDPVTGAPRFESLVEKWRLCQDTAADKSSAPDHLPNTR